MLMRKYQTLLLTRLHLHIQEEVTKAYKRDYLLYRLRNHVGKEKGDAPKWGMYKNAKHYSK